MFTHFSLLSHFKITMFTRNFQRNLLRRELNLSWCWLWLGVVCFIVFVPLILSIKYLCLIWENGAHNALETRVLEESLDLQTSRKLQSSLYLQRMINLQGCGRLQKLGRLPILERILRKKTFIKCPLLVGFIDLSFVGPRIKLKGSRPHVFGLYLAFNL